ncbi:MAG: four helix bundle protein [Anaerolineae bacterium]|nr:four helix bundle protein [Anaerolineae bacterium]NIN94443.1 four helix bundle protein [Anaerolineae bacterium]NIQ77506.1 four helix bundle protein [Anaerolineae bacterium]
MWQLAVDHVDLVCEIASQLPRTEDYNLKSQIARGVTSVRLNMAEGLSGRTDAEQARFLGTAIGSSSETVACHFLISPCGYL